MAESDLGSIVEGLAAKDAKAAADLLGAIEKRADALETFPMRGRVVPELAAVSVHRYRELIEGNYRIVYSVDGHRVGVVAALDGRRDLASVLLDRLVRSAY